MTQWSRRRMMWRMGSVAGTLGAPGALAGCGLGAPGGGAVPAQDLKGVTIEHWTFNGPTHPESIGKQGVYDDFTAHNPDGIKVDFSAPGNGAADTFQKYVAAISGGTPPDSVDGQHFYMSDLFRQSATLDVEAELKSNADWKKAKAALSQDIVNGWTWKGKLFGVPWYSSHFAMYYQPDYLKRANLAPPAKGWTRDQFVDYAKKTNRPPDIFAYEDQWSYSRTGMMVLNNGGRFLSADGTKFNYNSPEALEAVEWQYNLFKQGLLPSLDQFPGGKWKELMPDGKVALEFAVAARVPLYRQQGTQFGTCYYPIGPSSKDKKSVTHGEAYGIAVIKNKDARKQRAALLAALWGTRPDMGVVLATKAGVPPSYKSTVEDAAFQSKFKNDPDTWVFMDLIAGYIPMPNFPGFADVRGMADGKITEIWTGKSSIRDALDEITRLGQQRLDEMLK